MFVDKFPEHLKENNLRERKRNGEVTNETGVNSRNISVEIISLSLVSLHSLTSK